MFCGSTQLIRVGIERERVHVRYIVNNETDDKEYQGHDKTELQAGSWLLSKILQIFSLQLPSLSTVTNSRVDERIYKVNNQRRRGNRHDGNRDTSEDLL